MPANSGESFGISDPDHISSQLENNSSTVLTFILVIFIIMLINHHSY